MMRRYGLGLTIWSPLACGFLSGKYTRETLSKPENRYSGFDILPFDKEKGIALVERMRGIAAGHRASEAQIAIAWLLAKNAVSSVLLGASKLEQLEDNLGAAEIQLSAAELKELDDATAPAPVYPAWVTAKTSDAALTKALERDQEKA